MKTWSAGVGAVRRRVDLARAGRPQYFSKFFCPSLRPRRLTPLGSPAIRGEGEPLVTSPRTRRRAGVELAAAWGEGDGGGEVGGEVGSSGVIVISGGRIYSLPISRILYLFFKPEFFKESLMGQYQFLRT